MLCDVKWCNYFKNLNAYVHASIHEYCWLLECMCSYVRICACLCLDSCAHIHAYTHMRVNVHNICTHYAHMHIYTHVHMCIRVYPKYYIITHHAYKHTCIYTYIYAYIYIHTHICIHTHTHTHTHTYTHMHICMHMIYVHICIHAHNIYTHMHT